jgi:hypothetical protein
MIALISFQNGGVDFQNGRMTITLICNLEIETNTFLCIKFDIQKEKEFYYEN